MCDQLKRHQVASARCRTHECATSWSGIRSHQRGAAHIGVWPAEDDISIPEAKRNPVSEAKGAGAQRSGTTRLSEVTTATCPRRRSRSGVRRWLTTHHSPFTNQQKRWRSMKAKSFHYSFRFVFFWNEYTSSLCKMFGASPGSLWVTVRVFPVPFGWTEHGFSVAGPRSSVSIQCAASPKWDHSPSSGASSTRFSEVPSARRRWLTTHKPTEEMALDEG